MAESLSESLRNLERSESVLKDAEELMRAEEQAEPAYASGAPDFALARLEESLTAPPPKPEPPDAVAAMKDLEETAAATKADLMIAEAEDNPTPDLA